MMDGWVLGADRVIDRWTGTWGVLTWADSNTDHDLHSHWKLTMLDDFCP